jgi:hypothetical protein
METDHSQSYLGKWPFSNTHFSVSMSNCESLQAPAKRWLCHRLSRGGHLATSNLNKKEMFKTKCHVMFLPHITYNLNGRRSRKNTKSELPCSNRISRNNKKFWEELIAYFPIYDTGHIENDASNNSSIVACVFVTAVTFLPSRCLAPLRGFLPSRCLATIVEIHRHTYGEQRDLIGLLYFLAYFTILKKIE